MASMAPKEKWQLMVASNPARFLNESLKNELYIYLVKSSRQHFKTLLGARISIVKASCDCN